MESTITGWMYEPADPELGIGEGWAHEDCLVEDPDGSLWAKVVSGREGRTVVCENCGAQFFIPDIY